MEIKFVIGAGAIAMALLSAVATSAAQPPAQPKPGPPDAAAHDSAHDSAYHSAQEDTCSDSVDGCGSTERTTVCHDLCTPYSENGCFICSTRTYSICEHGKRVGAFDGELVIVCPYEKVDCVSTC